MPNKEPKPSISDLIIEEIRKKEQERKEEEGRIQPEIQEEDREQEAIIPIGDEGTEKKDRGVEEIQLL